MTSLAEKIKKTPLIRLFSIAILISFALWVLLIFLGDATQVQKFHSGNQTLFTDLLCPMGESLNLLTFELFGKQAAPRCYVPIVYVFCNFLNMVVLNPGFNNMQMASYQLVSYSLLLYSLVLVFLNFKVLNKFKNFDKLLFSTAVFASGIYIHAFERANVLFLVLFFLYWFVLFYKSENKFLKESALIFLSLAIAFKISPMAFLLLLFFEKDFKAIKRAICYSLCLFILPSLLFPSGIESLQTFVYNLSALSLQYASHPGLGKGVALNFLKSVFDIKEPSKCLVVITLIYTLMCFFCAFVSFFKKPLWKKLLPLSLLLILVPTISFEYNGLYFILPLVFYFADDTKKDTDYLYLIWFFFIFNAVVIVKQNVSVDIGIMGCVLQLFITSVREFDFKSYCRIFKENFDKKFFIDLTKLGAGLALSLLILALGVFIYGKTYSWDEFIVNGASTSRIIQTNVQKLDEDYKIEIETLFNVDDIKNGKTLFSTASGDDGFRLRVKDNSSPEFLYKNIQGEISNTILPEIDTDRNYKFKARITEKSVTFLLAEEHEYAKGEYVEFSPVSLIQTVNPKSISEINVDNSVQNFKLSLQNGKNSDWIVILSLILALLPLFLI